MSVDNLREVAWKTLHGWLREKIPQSAEGEKNPQKPHTVYCAVLPRLSTEKSPVKLLG